MSNVEAQVVRSNQYTIKSVNFANLLNLIQGNNVSGVSGDGNQSHLRSPMLPWSRFVP